MLPAIRNTQSDPIPWTPANRLSTLLDRFFDDPPFTSMTAAPSMPVAMWEDEHAIRVEMDMPGVNSQDVEVFVHEGTLTVRGERKAEDKGSGFDARTYGRFEQRFALSCPVDAGQVEAKLTDGVLSVNCPKSEAAKPRKIAIKA